MAGVHSVEVEGSEFASEVGGSLPDLDLGAMSGGDEPAASYQLSSFAPFLLHSLSVGRELDVAHWLLEVEVVEHSRSLEVD